MGGGCPTQAYRDWSKYKAPSANTREKKGRNFILLLIANDAEDDTLLRFFQVFFPKQRKIAAYRHSASSSKEVVVPRPEQAHY